MIDEEEKETPPEPETSLDEPTEPTDPELPDDGIEDPSQVPA